MGEVKGTRKKGCYVGAPAIFKLTLACQQMCAAFSEGGYGCYLVGSALQRPDWRDVDVVLILSDRAFADMFPGAPEHGHWECNPKWLLMTVAFSAWLSEQSGLPIDFKFQPQSWANEHHQGQRDALGMLIDKRSEE